MMKLIASGVAQAPEASAQWCWQVTSMQDRLWPADTQCVLQQC